MRPRLVVMPPLAPDTWVRRPLSQRAWPLEDPGHRLLAWGRHGVHRGALSIGLRPGDEVLAPAWHHGSEIEALVRAGLTVRFYDAAPAVHPEPEDLPVTEATRALHLTHVLGAVAPADRWRAFCDDRGLLLIEDAAQAWMAQCGGRPAGSWGDVGVFCLYKTVGLPEGAVLVTRRAPAPDAPRIDHRFGIEAHVRAHASWMVGRSGVLHALALKMRPRREVPYDPERDFQLRDIEAGPWRPARFLLDRLADPHIAEARRANHARLLSRLGPLVPAPFDRADEGASPFAFPIEVDDKRAVIAALEAEGILPLDFWSVPHPLLDSTEYPEATRRRARTVALPVHQELRPRDLERIADTVERILARAT